MSDKYTPEERFIIETNRMRLDPQPHQRLLDPTPSPRRIENRVAALEAHLKRYDEVFNGLGDTIGSRPMGSQSITEDITDLQQQVQALTELMRVLNEEQIPQIIRNFDNHDQHFDVIYRKLGLGVAPDQRVSAAEANAAINTPDQPAADDAEKWGMVNTVWYETESNLRHDDARAAVAKAIELGLVPRVDPDDPEQQQAVLDAIEKWEPMLAVNYRLNTLGRHILTALANMNGRTNG